MWTRSVGLGIVVAALAVGVPGGRAAPDGESSSARVVAETLDVYDGPDARAFVIGRLRRGSRVEIRERHGEWLAIEPPSGSFCWIDARVIEDRPDGAAVVLDDGTVVRSGVVGARMPGPPRLALRRGMEVRPIDRRPLSIGEGSARRVWRAIEPPSGLAFFVRADGIAGHRTDSAMAAGTRRVTISSPGSGSSTSFRPLSVDDALASVAPPGEPRTLDPGLAARLGAVEAEHRAALRMPLDSWRLGAVRSRYEELLAATSDPDGQDVLRGRLQHVERQQQAADASRRFRDVVQQSRGRDRQVEQLLAEAAADPPESREDLAYDGVGMLQRSSRLVDGVRVYALIGSEGHAEAYLKVPPGLEVEPLVSRQVGVRGEVGYNAGLRARVISVRELVPLSPAP